MSTNKISLTEVRRLFADLKNQWIQKYPELRGWTFAYDNARGRFGYCDYSKREIGLSRRLTPYRTMAEITNTILHEMAHAITPGDGHGRKWRALFISMGGDGQRCGKINATPEQAVQIFKYIAQCPGCDRVVYANRTKKARTSCGICSPRFNPEFEFKYVPAAQFKA